MKEFLQKNTWNLLITTVAIVIAFTTLSSRVDAIAQDHENIEGRLSALQTLTERIVRLEEGRQINADNIKEIRDNIKIINEDIKSIKEHFEIK